MISLNTLNDSIGLISQVAIKKNPSELNAWYGPWESKADFDAYLDRCGLDPEFDDLGVVTIAIWNEDKTAVTEYWNPDASIDFVEKAASIDLAELDRRYVRVEELDEETESEESVLATKDYVEEALQNVVSKDELTELVGTPRVEAEGTKGEEDYKPVVPATGLHADIEAVAYRRFMQLIGLVGAADEEVMKNVADVEHNLHSNIKEVQANLYGNIRGVRNEISDMIRKYLNQEGSNYVLAHDAYELQNMISADDDKKVVVMKDVVLSKTISVESGVDKVLDLNGCIISNERLDYTTTEDGHTVTSNVDAITVKTGGKLTLVGNGYVTTIAGTASPLYANGGEIVVNGGVYESLQGLDAGGGYSLVYADKTGKVEINDGYFIVNGNPDEKKYQYILNASDPATEAVITVKGGYFYNWDPSTHDNNGHQEVVIPEDYEVKVIENGTFYQHVGTWYHVVKKQA